MSQPEQCGQAHHTYPQTLCAAPPGHDGLHVAILVIDGEEGEGVSWDTVPARLGPIDHARRTDAEEEQRRATPGRHTADTITDDELDALYTRLAKAERAVNLLADSHRRAEKAEAELLDWKKLLQKSREMTAAHWAAIERVREYAADLGRTGWTQAAIARRILAAIDEEQQR